MGAVAAFPLRLCLEVGLGAKVLGGMEAFFLGDRRGPPSNACSLEAWSNKEDIRAQKKENRGLSLTYYHNPTPARELTAWRSGDAVLQRCA